MNSLIPQNHSIRISSRDIAEATDKLHKNVLRDIKSLIEQGAIAALNFEPSDYTDASGKKSPEYLLDFHAVMVLVTGYDAKRRAAVIDRWLALEKGEATPAFQIPQTMGDALRLAAQYHDEAKESRARLQIVEPKADALDRLATATDGSFCLTDAAKQLQMRPKDLINFLSSLGWIYRRVGNGVWTAYQDKLKQGLLEHKTKTIISSDGSERVHDQVRVTAKGMAKISLLLEKDKKPLFDHAL